MFTWVLFVLFMWRPGNHSTQDSKLDLQYPSQWVVHYQFSIHDNVENVEIPQQLVGQVLFHISTCMLQLCWEGQYSLNKIWFRVKNYDWTT